MMNNSRSIDFVICAAGEGSRLREMFGGIPKPLIQIRGRTLLEISLDSLDIFAGDRLLMVVQKKHGLRERMESSLNNRYLHNRVEWIELDSLTSGQLETALKAAPRLRPDSGIAIFNSDTFCRSVQLGAWMRTQPADGMILVHQNSDPQQTHFSFCRTEPGSDRVVEVAEKRRISPLASVGLYYFKNAGTFEKYARQEMDANSELKEKYVIPAYSHMIRDGRDVRVVMAETFLPMGTVQDLERDWHLDMVKLKSENAPGTILIDLDGTLTIEDSAVEYANKKPNHLVIQRLRELKAKGFQIIVHTARRMRTHRADEARVIRDIGMVTLEWLNQHGVPFDGIRFGKPYGENGMIVDDLAVRPIEFLNMSVDQIQARIIEERELLRVKCLNEG